jgi:two-component system nitrogen regulation response regulator GlnG
VNTDSTWESVERQADPFQPCIGLRIVFHPDLQRVGEVAPLFDSGGAGSCKISRTEPQFRNTSGQLSGPLASQRVSRSALNLGHNADGEIWLESGPGEVYVNGARVPQTVHATRDEVARGIIIGLGGHVVLWLGPLRSEPVAVENSHGLIGSSEPIRHVREEIERVSLLDVPILLRGETGTGKELVASAIHRGGQRADRPFIAVNMAAIPATTAASELFGHRRGAFTGASNNRNGYFRDADGGSLFLDEIGDTPSDIQPMLLRAIELGEVQPVGAGPSSVDVRVIAATDSNLEVAIASGQFRSPLLRRFGYSIRLPTLRERRQDIGLLFVNFLQQELAVLGTPTGWVWSSVDERPWLPSEFALRLVNHHWPGNVRELRNVVRRIAIRSQALRVSCGPPLTLAELGLAEHGPSPQPAALVSAATARPGATETTGRVRSKNWTDDELLEVWKASGFDLKTAMGRLHVGKTWLSARLNRCAGVVRVKDLKRETVERALREAGSVDRAAEYLQVSKRALLLHAKRLQLKCN